MTLMTLISRRSATHEDFGRDKTYRQPVAQWTDYERRCNRIVEDLMILDAAKHRKRRTEAEALTGSNEERRQQYWQPILDVMDGPMTSREVARLVRRDARALWCRVYGAGSPSWSRSAAVAQLLF